MRVSINLMSLTDLSFDLNPVSCKGSLVLTVLLILERNINLDYDTSHKQKRTFVLDSERRYLIYLTPELLTFLFKAIRFNINRFSFDNDKKCLKC